MIKDGGNWKAFDAILRVGIWPAYATAPIACPDDIVMCGNGTFSMEFKGRGGHASHQNCATDTASSPPAAVNGHYSKLLADALRHKRHAVISVTANEWRVQRRPVIPEKRQR